VYGTHSETSAKPARSREVRMCTVPMRAVQIDGSGRLVGFATAGGVAPGVTPPPEGGLFEWVKFNDKGEVVDWKLLNSASSK
jgi:hypothetical protein